MKMSSERATRCLNSLITGYFKFEGTDSFTHVGSVVKQRDIHSRITTANRAHLADPNCGAETETEVLRITESKIIRRIYEPAKQESTAEQEGYIRRGRTCKIRKIPLI